MRFDKFNSPLRISLLLVVATIMGTVCIHNSAIAQTEETSDSLRYSMFLMDQGYDTPIDPELFLIRPGEKLQVRFIGSKLGGLTLTVDPEGRIVDNTIGVISLRGLTLSECRTKLTPILKTLYNSESIELSVSSPRAVSIYVSGAVERPGLYRAFLSQHISEVIEFAGGLTKDGSRRRIELQGGPRALTVDLDRADFLADASSDPYVYAGNSVYVPARSQDVVSVVGEVATPKSIELIDGDDFSMLVKIAGGVTNAGDANGAFVLGTEKSLKAGAIIVVPPVSTQANLTEIQVFGAVKSPGHFNTSSSLLLGSALQLAGDPADNANLVRTTVFRHQPPNEWGAISQARYPVSTIAASGKPDLEFQVKYGDSIFVPVLTSIVIIEGEVANPGVYPFVEGKNGMYYIELAGGFIEESDRSQMAIFDKVTGMTAHQSPSAPIHDGDSILILRIKELK